MRGRGAVSETRGKGATELSEICNLRTGDSFLHTLYLLFRFYSPTLTPFLVSLSDCFNPPRVPSPGDEWEGPRILLPRLLLVTETKLSPVRGTGVFFFRFGHQGRTSAFVPFKALLGDEDSVHSRQSWALSPSLWGSRSHPLLPSALWWKWGRRWP